LIKKFIGGNMAGQPIIKDPEKERRKIKSVSKMKK